MYVPIYISLLTKHLVRELRASCCSWRYQSAAHAADTCVPSAITMRQWPMWLNPVPLSLIRCTCVVLLFLRCYVICHAVLIAQCGKVLRLPLRSYHLHNGISQFRFDTPTQSVSWSPVVLHQMRVSSSHLIPVRPNQLILWTWPLFVPTVLWTSLRGYPPLGCDILWLFGLWLVPIYSGIKYPYAWSSSVVQDSLLKIWRPDYQHILWSDVWVVYQFPVKNSWAMLPILLFWLVPCTLLLPLIMRLSFVIWNASLSHCWQG